MLARVRRLEVEHDSDVTGVGPGAGIAHVDVAAVRGLEHQGLLDLDRAVCERELEVECAWHHRGRQARARHGPVEADGDASLTVLRLADVDHAIRENHIGK